MCEECIAYNNAFYKKSFTNNKRKLDSLKGRPNVIGASNVPIDEITSSYIVSIHFDPEAIANMFFFSSERS
jgi:hypothetical protein